TSILRKVWKERAMRRTKHKLIRAAQVVVLCLFGLGAALPAVAQTDIDRRLWTAVSVQGQLNGQWRWASDSLVRGSDGAGALDIVGERVTVTRSITPQSNIGLGYAWAGGVFHGRFLQEQRFAEQFTWSGQGRVRVALRTRLEECLLTGDDAMRLQAR